jgi:hypothetical protein
MVQQGNRRAGKKSKRKDCRQIENSYKTVTRPERRRNSTKAGNQANFFLYSNLYSILEVTPELYSSQHQRK